MKFLTELIKKMAGSITLAAGITGAIFWAAVITILTYIGQRIVYFSGIS